MRFPLHQFSGLCLCAVSAIALSGCGAAISAMNDSLPETQLTHDCEHHILTNTSVFSPDGAWIYYDTRDQSGQFNGTKIGRVCVKDGVCHTVYTSKNGACCGVVTVNPVDGRAIFIHGPEFPDENWSYAFSRRRGVIADPNDLGNLSPLDANNYVPDFQPGALRGGSHVHVFSPDGQWVSFTYDDEVLLQRAKTDASIKPNRNVAVSVPVKDPIKVNRNHPRNNDGNYFSVVVTRIVAQPKPGSDEIMRACEEGWIGKNGFVRKDGSRQKRALAFQGTVVAPNGKPHAEVFIAELPDNMTLAGNHPLEGTLSEYPAPPKGVVQKRLTFTQDRRFPGIQGARHWLRSSPDGSQIAFLMRDDNGFAQLWSVSPEGENLRQITHLPYEVASAFSWSPDGRWIAFAADGSIFKADATTGKAVRLTKAPADKADAPTPDAVIFSPDGSLIAYNKAVQASDGKRYVQVFLVGTNASAQ